MDYILYPSYDIIKASKESTALLFCLQTSARLPSARFSLDKRLAKADMRIFVLKMAHYTKKQKGNIVSECVGQKYGKLTVTRFVEYRRTPKSYKVPMVECKCDCGNTKIVSLWDIRTGKTKTCGMNHPHYEDRSLPAFNHIYDHSYRARAIRSGIPFELTKEQFRELASQPCHYCGVPPENVSYRPSRVAKVRGTITTGKQRSQWIYNGLDRIDSDKGYTINNVVACCGICNHAKHTMSYRDFIRWLGAIALFRSKV